MRASLLYFAEMMCSTNLKLQLELYIAITNNPTYYTVVVCSNSLQASQLQDDTDDLYILSGQR